MKTVVLFIVLTCLFLWALALGNNVGTSANSFQVKVLDTPVQDYKMEIKDIEAKGGLDFSITLEVIEFYRMPIEYAADMPAAARVSINGLECHLASCAEDKTAALYYFFSDGKWKEARARLSEASLQKGSRVQLKIEKALDEAEPEEQENSEDAPPGDFVDIRGNQTPLFVFYKWRVVYFSLKQG